MKTQHYAVLGSIVVALALQIAGLKSWSEALTPQFVSGTLVAIAGVLGGLFADKPGAAPVEKVGQP